MTKYTSYQDRYFAEQLLLKRPQSSYDSLASAMSGVKVDLNPHQVDAALFAMQSPLSSGVLMADEVGLGKTIEAGLVLAQYWAERKRNILLIVPAALRTQWRSELSEKFYIDSLILESSNFNKMRKEGCLNPFDAKNQVVICSYNFAANKDSFVHAMPWDLVVLDEAHRLRNVYKPQNVTANKLKNALKGRKKLLLTATPLQNNLMELYGLVSFIDEHVFGDAKTFREMYVAVNNAELRNRNLRDRLSVFCKRTLRKQVTEYVRYTERHAILQEYVGGYAPYGYVLHPTIRNKLAVDPEAADVIRRIFREALEGSNTSQIARSLNDDGIPTPGQYFKSKHPDKKKFSNMSEKISWETVMVYNILKNLVYTGTLVSRKMKSCGVGSKKRVVNEPIIVEGTHEAIISKEDFELAQKVIRGGGRNPTRKQHDYPLKGLVRCGNCKRAMTRRKNKAGIRYFQCIHSVNSGNTDCPVGRSFPEMDIEKVVFHALTQFLALAQKEAIQNREVGDLRKSAIKECADKIRTLQKQNEQHKASKLRLYEKYAAGSITKEAYIQQKAAADVKIAENDGAIQRSHERMKELDSETACSDEKLDAVCEQYADCKALTYELTHAFISAVYIYDLDNIEIVWKFKDFLTTSEGEAK